MGQQRYSVQEGSNHGVRFAAELRDVAVDSAVDVAVDVAVDGAYIYR